MIDVSGSVDATEYALQRDGYFNAFKNAGIQSQIVNGTGGDGIAVRVIEFSSSATQIVGWTPHQDGRRLQQLRGCAQGCAQRW